MSQAVRLRRHLYEQFAATSWRARRSRRALRRQIAVLVGPVDGPDDGPAGVREPRRPLPPHDDAGAVRRP